MPQVSAFRVPTHFKSLYDREGAWHLSTFYELRDPEKSLEVWLDWVEKAVGFWRKWIKISREGQSVKCEKEKAGAEMTVKRGLGGSVWRYAKLPRGGGSS